VRSSRSLKSQQTGLDLPAAVNVVGAAASARERGHGGGGLLVERIDLAGLSAISNDAGLHAFDAVAAILGGRAVAPGAAGADIRDALEDFARPRVRSRSTARSQGGKLVAKRR